MDRLERAPSMTAILRQAFRSMQAGLWTALPAIVERFDAAKMTVDAQPAVSGRARDKDGVWQPIAMPKLLDCPVVFPGGGGATLTFPVKAGDECLVVFASRCIDGWWDQGGSPVPPSLRMHDLSDGFAFLGVRSRPRAFAVATGKVQLRADDGATYVQLDPAGKVVKVVAPNGIDLNGVTIDASGNIHTAASLTADTEITVGGKALRHHKHTGVTAGASQTGEIP